MKSPCDWDFVTMVTRELDSEETPPQFRFLHDHVGLDSRALTSRSDRGSEGCRFHP